MDRLKLTATTNMLINNGFRKISPVEYVYKFPCYKHKSQTLIQCILTADIEEREVYVEVIDICNGTLYTPYYYNEYGGDNAVLNEVQEKVKKELTRLSKQRLVSYKKEDKE